MKKLAFSLIGLFILSLGIYSCSKENQSKHKIPLLKTTSISLKDKTKLLDSLASIIESDPDILYAQLQTFNSKSSFYSYYQNKGKNELDLDNYYKLQEGIKNELNEMDEEEMITFINTITIDPPVFTCRDLAGYNKCVEGPKADFEDAQEDFVWESLIAIGGTLVTEGWGSTITFSTWIIALKKRDRAENKLHQKADDCKRVYCD
jgi:hypothetical protein